MQLKDYPAAIAAKQRLLHTQELGIRDLQLQLDQLTARLERTIAFDDSLKNDAQRKARRAELMELEEYQDTLAALQNFQDEKALIEIDLQLLRNQFSVLKLELRQAIAQTELQAA